MFMRCCGSEAGPGVSQSHWTPEVPRTATCGSEEVKPGVDLISMDTDGYGVMLVPRPMHSCDVLRSKEFQNR